MTIFKYYNVQALPLDKKYKTIGSEGYNKLFNNLKKLVDTAVNKNQIISVSASLRNHFHFAPIEVKFHEGMISGKFIKYDEVHEVIETLSKKKKYTATSAESSKVFEYEFVFDSVTHILAIENGKSIPACNPLIEAFHDILTPSLKKDYKNHQLHIIELNAAQDLEEVIENAKSYIQVKTDITFSNSQDWQNGIEDEIAEIEQELKDKNINEVHHQEKAAKSSTMTEPSKRAYAYMALSCKFGNSEITYKNKDGEKERFIMKEHPVKLAVDKSIKGKELSHIDFLYEVKNSIRIANKLTKAGLKILGKLKDKFTDK
jgi:hypothetical protein